MATITGRETPVAFTHDGVTYELEHMFTATQRGSDVGQFAIFHGDTFLGEFNCANRLNEGGEIGYDLPPDAEIVAAAVAALDSDPDKQNGGAA